MFTACNGWILSKQFQQLSRVILELNPFGILIRGAIHTGRPMFPCALKNSGRSRIRTDFVNPFAPCIDLYLNKIRAHLYTAVETFLVLGAAPAGGGVVRLFSSSPSSTGTSRMICCSDAMCLEKSSPSLHLLSQSRQKYQ